jgi:hypothetical protein
MTRMAGGGGDSVREWPGSTPGPCDTHLEPCAIMISQFDYDIIVWSTMDYDIIVNIIPMIS